MNKVHPLVSIIIPTYNRAHLIGETLDSVLAQTYPHWECIVVDDGSTDNTAEVVGVYLKKDPRFQYHHRPANRPKGANACRNYGLELIMGDYFMFLDSDDLLHDSCLDYRINNITDVKKKVFIYTMLKFYKYPGDSIEIVNKNAGTLELALCMFLRHNLPWQITAFLIHKSLKNLRFNEKLQRLQDVSYSINLLLTIKKDEIYFSKNKPDSYYRISLNSRFTIDFINRLINILIHYITYIDSLLLEKCTKKKYLEYKRYQFLYFVFFYKTYLLPNISKINSLSELKNLLHKRNYITNLDFVLMGYLEFLYFINFKRKGLGIYRIIKKWKNREYRK